MEDNPLLGTSGKEAVPFEYQVEEQQIARKRALAQAMLARSQQELPKNQMFGLHMARQGVLPHINNALDAYLAQRGMGQAASEQTALGQKMQASRAGDMAEVQSLENGMPGQLVPQAGPPQEGQGELPPIMQGAKSPDIKGAIAKAMASKWGNVNAYGKDLQKDQRGMRNEIGKIVGGADPAAGAQFIQANDPMAPVAPIRTAPIEMGQFPGGGNFAITRDYKGSKPTIVPEPKANSVTVNNGGKTDVELDKVLIGDLSKARGDVADVPNQISTILRTNELINKGAVTGGGATAFQALRKFGQAFGVNVPETGLTEETSMQLGQNILANARKLAPVTQNDVVMLNKLLGSIDTDPSAMREINAMMLAKSLITVDKHNAQVETIKQTTSGSPEKYNPMRVEMGDVDTKDPALLGRAYQLMKDSGHDMSRYKFDGKPVSEIDLDFGFHKPAAGSKGPAEYKVDPVGRIKRVPLQ